MTETARDSEGLQEPLLTLDALRAARVPARSRWGWLFGVTERDLAKAESRLTALLSAEGESRSTTPRPGAGSEGAAREQARISYAESNEDANSLEQATLFPDDPSLHDRGLDAGSGFRGPTACNAAGITYRQLDYWAKTGLVEPSLRSAGGDARLYSIKDVMLLKVIKRLLDAGLSLQVIRTAIHHLRSRPVEELAGVTLMSDGESVYECTSNDEVIDLLQGGRGVFGIAMGGVAHEVRKALAELPAEPSSDAEREAAWAALTANMTDPAAGSGAFLLAALRSLSTSIDSLTDEEQASVVSLMSDLHLTEGLKEMPNVVNLASARATRRSDPKSGPRSETALGEGNA